MRGRQARDRREQIAEMATSVCPPSLLARITDHDALAPQHLTLSDANGTITLRRERLRRAGPLLFELILPPNDDDDDFEQYSQGSVLDFIWQSRTPRCAASGKADKYVSLQSSLNP